MIDLEPIKERLNAATPGPWGFRDPENFWQGIVAGGEQIRGNICVLNDGGQTPESAEGNAHLIANAPTDIASLIDEVEKLRVELFAKENQ